MTNRKSYPCNPVVPLWTLYGNPNKGFGPPHWGTVYISEVNGARKVKSDAQIAINKNADPVQIFFLGVALEYRAPTQFFQPSGIVQNESS